MTQKKTPTLSSPPGKIRHCSIKGCVLKHLAKGLCSAHYARNHRKLVPEIYKAIRIKYRNKPENIIKIKKYDKNYRKNNLMRCKILYQNWYKINKKAHYNKTRLWASENRDKIRIYNRRYNSKNRPKIKYLTAKYRADLDKRTPDWADLEGIEFFYTMCPPGQVVDHIHPLRGKRVSGLHVLENLQYLTPEANSRKSNKFEPRAD